MSAISSIRPIFSRSTDPDRETCTHTQNGCHNNENDFSMVINNLINCTSMDTILVMQQKNITGSTINLVIDGVSHELDVSDFIAAVINKIHEIYDHSGSNDKILKTLTAIGAVLSDYSMQHNQSAISNEDMDIIINLINTTIQNNKSHSNNSDIKILQSLIKLQSYSNGNSAYTYSLDSWINEYSEKLANNTDITQHLAFVAGLIASTGL